MVDKGKDQNQDEYQFADLDIIEPESGNTDEDSLASDSSISNQQESRKLLVRNALIAVGAFVALMVLYKFFGAMFSSDSTEVKAPVSMVKPNPVPIVPVQPKLVQPMIVEQAASPQMNQKISALELSQGTISTDVNNLNTQVATLTTSVTDLNAKVDQLNQTINTLAVQVAEESRQVALLTAKKATVRPHFVQRKPHAPSISYYIQAVIPGRAWLVATNGSTMTIREGSSVPGYGVIKLIDANQGRILTSSGRVIGFSQQDT